MTFSTFLKKYLIEVVENYRKYFWKSLTVMLLFSILFFMVALLLLYLTYFDDAVQNHQFRLYYFLFRRYSYHETYSLVDNSKSFLIFFIALFTIGLKKQPDPVTDENEFTFGKFVRQIKLNDIVYLLCILALSVLADFIVFKADTFSFYQFPNESQYKLIHDLVFHIRIYVPLILFSFALQSLLNKKKPGIILMNLFFLYISLWLMNEFCYEISIWVSSFIFGTLMLPFADSNNIYIYESVLMVPLIAFYFIGYSTAMTTPLALLSPKNTELTK